jgi:predicted N-acetyltransferase YhbS
MKQTPLDIAIRKATDADVDDVAAVFAAAFEPLRSIYRPTAEVAARQPQRAQAGTRLVAEVAGRLVATVQFDSHQEHVHIMGLAVHPDFQRMGIAGRMIDWIESQARSLGHNLVVLDTIKETGNVSVFEKLGFRVYNEEITSDFESDTYPVLHEVKMERTVA